MQVDGKDTGAPLPRSQHPGLRSIQLPGRGTWRMSRDDARSMLPMFRGGETISWVAVPVAALEPGDLVFYGIPSTRRPAAGDAAGDGGCLAGRLAAGRLTLAVHRLVRIERAPGGGVQLRTKGDGRPALDVEPVRPENLVGVVVAFGRDDGASFRLDTEAARRHARRVLLVSRVGAALYRPAVLADAALRRLLLRRFDPRPARALAAGLQALAQRVLHRVAFARAHRPPGGSP